MIFFNRSGLSSVVGNVLMVLLVIVGVAVIWSVVKPTIDKSAKQIEADCLNIDVQAVSCVLNLTKFDFGGSLVNRMNVTTLVKRNTGGGNLKEVRLQYHGKGWGINFVSPTPPVIYGSPTLISSIDGNVSIFDLNELESRLIVNGVDITDFPDQTGEFFDSLFTESLLQLKVFFPTSVEAVPVLKDGRLCQPLYAPVKCTCVDEENPANGQWCTTIGL